MFIECRRELNNKHPLFSEGFHFIFWGESKLSSIEDGVQCYVEKESWNGGKDSVCVTGEAIF